MSTASPTLGWVVLYVDNVATSAAFYCSAFGLAVRFADESGRYAEFDTGATVLALCARDLASDSAGRPVGRAEGDRSPGNVTLVYADVDGQWRHAVDAGATTVHEPTTKPWGQRCAYVSCPDGHLIELATAISG